MLQPSLPWEDQSRRLELPESLGADLVGRSRTLAVPHSIMAKIASRHPSDVASLNRLGELFDRWELTGLAPKHPDRLEVYGRLDGIWHTAVIALTVEGARFNVLVTFHRIYERKVLNRERQGRLKRRPKE